MKFLDFKGLTKPMFSKNYWQPMQMFWQQTRLVWEISALTVILNSHLAFFTTHIFFLIKRSLTQVKTTAGATCLHASTNESVENIFFLHTLANY